MEESHPTPRILPGKRGRIQAGEAGLFWSERPRSDPADLCDPLPLTDAQERKSGGTPTLPNEGQLIKSMCANIRSALPTGNARCLSETWQEGGRGAGGAAAPRLSPPGGGAAGPYLVPAVPRARQGAVAGARSPVREVPGQLLQGGRGGVPGAPERPRRHEVSFQALGLERLPAQLLREAPRRRCVLPRPHQGRAAATSLPAPARARRARLGHLAAAPARPQVRRHPPPAPGAPGKPPGFVAWRPPGRQASVRSVLAVLTAAGQITCSCRGDRAFVPKCPSSPAS